MKRRYPIKIPATILLQLVVLLSISTSFHVFADNSEIIDTTIKISVCGNSIAEGGEECDTSDLRGLSCWDLYHESGNLECSPSCNYDESLCIGTRPTPTPSTTPSHTPSPTKQPDTDKDDNNNKDSNSSEKSDSLTETLQKKVQETVDKIVADFKKDYVKKKELSFDADGNGFVETNEVFAVIKSWVSAWRGGDENKTECDINSDGTCSLTDFSILLYYVDK
jgi:hypothetical protein